MLPARVLARILHGRGGSCAISLIPILLVLLPLAHARPPDPVWIAGIYDEADLDDVVVAVASATGLETSGLSGKPVNAATRTVRPLLPGTQCKNILRDTQHSCSAIRDADRDQLTAGLRTRILARCRAGAARFEAFCRLQSLLHAATSVPARVANPLWGGLEDNPNGRTP